MSAAQTGKTGARHRGSLPASTWTDGLAGRPHHILQLRQQLWCPGSRRDQDEVRRMNRSFARADASHIA